MRGVTNDDVNPVKRLNSRKGSCGEKGSRDDMRVRTPKGYKTGLTKTRNGLVAVPFKKVRIISTTSLVSMTLILLNALSLLLSCVCKRSENRGAAQLTCLTVRFCSAACILAFVYALNTNVLTLIIENSQSH